MVQKSENDTLVLALNTDFLVASGLDMLPCLMKLVVTAQVGQRLGKQPEAFAKQRGSRLVAKYGEKKMELMGRKGKSTAQEAGNNA